MCMSLEQWKLAQELIPFSLTDYPLYSNELAVFALSTGRGKLSTYFPKKKPRTTEKHHPFWLYFTNNVNKNDGINCLNQHS